MIFYRDLASLIWEARRVLLLRLLPLYLAVTLLTDLAFDRFGGWLVEGMLVPGEGRLRFFAVFFLIWLVFWGFLMGLAVVWHRSVLRPSGAALTGPAMGLYLWALIRLGVLMFFVVGLPGWILSWVFFENIIYDPTFPGMGLSLLLVFEIVLPALGAWVWLRAGLILPAAADENLNMGLAGSWAATRPYRVALAGLVLVQLGAGAVSEPVSQFGFQLDVALWTLMALIGLAALTLMYRDAVEPRAG